MNKKVSENIFLRGLAVGNDRRAATLLLTEMAALTAIVVILQLLCYFIRFGIFSITLALLPIVIGSALYGPLAGAWLGLVFGAVVLLTGDANLFLAFHPAGTVITVLCKGMFAGFFSGLVFRLIEKKNPLVAVIAAAIVCPVVNTGVFALGGYLFFLPLLKEWMAGTDYTNVTSYLFFGIIGGNFFFELGYSVVLAPIVHRILLLIKKNARGRKT